ncbi:putative polygalacturonase isoform X2 [Silene latifolia]|uniref:putative polygalacturonase isoform X2 n=1 Tax=Silene latifolia TaxID=37657 RepID=UPI003D784DFE
MKMLVALLLLFVLCNAVDGIGEENKDQCEYKPQLDPRPHSVSIVEFGAVGDGKTSNTGAFQNAIFYLNSFADKGGAQLYVPPGKWLTGSFNLTNHLTLFLEKDAVIIGSQDPSHWGIADPLPSYGSGFELPGSRYRSLINGYNLQDVVITGNNGTIDGQGSFWWDAFLSDTLNYSRPHLVEIVDSVGVVVSNLTFLNAPAYNIRPVYCSHVLVQNISAFAPASSPHTVGIVPDSSDHMCIENSNISMGYDAISLKSGWDQYGIAYDRPTTYVHIKNVQLQASTGSAIAFGSQMSGGISNVLVDGVHISNSFSGIEFRTAIGRGGYMEKITVSDIVIENTHTAFNASGQWTNHPDGEYDQTALPVLGQITLEKVVGSNITIAGSFSGIEESPFKFSLSDISLALNSISTTPWICSNVVGSSKSVFPEPCPELENSLSTRSSDGLVSSL